MSDKPKNLEELPQGGSHVLDIQLLQYERGPVANPDGYSPPDNPAGFCDPAWYIYDVGTNTYNVAPGAYNPPSTANLRYGGSTGRFLITPVAQATTVLSKDLSNERWAIGWTATINGKTDTFFEFVTVVPSGAATFGDSGYCGIDEIRDDVGQLVKSETYTISVSGPAVIDTITFNDNETKQIVSVIVNEAELTSGWIFKKPNKLVFSPALALDDVVEVKRDVCMTDAEINLQSVAVSNYINGQLSKVYAIPFDAPYPPLVETLCMKLTSAEIRMKLFDSTDRDGDRRGEAQWKRWHEKLMELKNEDVVLVGDDGTLVDTLIGSGVEISPTNLEPVFSLDDIKDPSQISGKTDWNFRRHGF